MDRIIKFVKQETVFCVSVLLALVSMFFVKPSSQYIEYIDYNVLLILFSLMLVVEGLSRSGFFTWLMHRLLKVTNSTRTIAVTFVMSTFVASMFITNDVALITFVPFLIMVLSKVSKEKYIIYVVALQTVAANLGSMVLPTGNPHNIYLYSVADITLAEFFILLLPYTVLSLVLLLICTLLIPNEKVTKNEGKAYINKVKFVVMASLFGICIMSVIKIIPCFISCVIVVIAVIAIDRSILKKVDYVLLATFVMFFVFVGNMKNIPGIYTMLSDITKGREMSVGIIASQFISNVPASILLSGFTDNIKELIVGANIGGLGTVIASMANLISYKIYARSRNSSPKKYLLVFTLVCVVFLIPLVLMNRIINNV